LGVVSALPTATGDAIPLPVRWPYLLYCLDNRAHRRGIHSTLHITKAVTGGRVGSKVGGKVAILDVVTSPRRTR
jgi:hypothetical protein